METKIRGLPNAYACITGIIVLILQLLFGCSAWWYFSAAIMFYLWYGIEYLIIKFFRLKDEQGEQYHDISFEEEAHNNDTNLNYCNERKHYAWFKYLKIKSNKED